MDAWWAYHRARQTYRKLMPETRKKIEAILDARRERSSQTRPPTGPDLPG